MLERERGKSKALRIDINYYRHRTWLEVWRDIAAMTGLVAAALYGGWVLSLGWGKAPANAASQASRSSQLSTGPLSLVHAHFESDCESCHSNQLGIALAHDAWQPTSESRLKLQESKCNDECHNVNGHAQGVLARPEMDRDCARCHREHLGRGHLLASISSKNCIDCHRDLGIAGRPGAHLQVTATVSSFSIASHGIVASAPPQSNNRADDPQAPRPQFRSLLSDRGRVRFDHAQHLRPGQVDPDSKGGFQLGMLAPALRQVYGQPGQSESSLVQLTCSNCHAPYALQDPARDSAIAVEEGRFYAPIDFDKHCAACHQISFAGQTEKDLPLPHVAQREEFARLLGVKQIAAALEGKVVEPADLAAGHGEDEAPTVTGRTVELARDKVEAGVDAVFMRCTQCHLEEDTRPETIARALAGTLEPLVPRRWLQHGYFDHASHAGITRCAYCHSMPTTVGVAVDNQRVLIGGPETCVGCHRSASLEAPPEFASQSLRLETLGRKNQPTWASDACTTCHRYHWSRFPAATDRRAAVPE